MPKSGMRIRYKIMLLVGLAVGLGLVLTVYFYSDRQEALLRKQNEAAMERLAESVSHGLQSVMLDGSANIAYAYADRLKRLPEISDFFIIRTNGQEAFLDNATIEDVNRRRGMEDFSPRETEKHVQVMPADDARLLRVIQDKAPNHYYDIDGSGSEYLVFLAPIENSKACYKCHGKANPVRGVMKLTTSMASVERDILKVRQDSLIVLGGALLGVMLLTGYLMGRTVVTPIEDVTAAMAKVSDGALDHRIPVKGSTELQRMASSFNEMTNQVQTTYAGLKREQDKLTTIIFGAGEGIVVTDSGGSIVLVNPAAQQLLEKTSQQIIDGGMENLLDDPDTMRPRLADSEVDAAPIDVLYKNRVLQTFVSTIHVANGHRVGSACLLRDITEEKRLEEDLRRLATTDALTGLFNRRHLDDTLVRELDRSRRSGMPLSVVMFDVDHFKKFNDTHGHDQGDRVLQTVAKCLREALRKYDYPCRYGGEEFVGILPNTSADGAYSVAERLRKDVETTEVDGLHVTISLGVATFPDIPVETAEKLIEYADEALYRSKEGGRNRTTRAAPVREEGATG